LLAAKWHQTGSSYRGEITWKEFGINALAVVAVTSIVYFAGSYGAMWDHNIVNGEVTSKYKDRVSCRHSHTVCTGSGKTRTCRTWHEHMFDYDWVVKSNVGSTRIDTIDRQGTREPPRWTAVVIGEPYAEKYSYINYIKAAPESLLHYSKGKILYDNIIPDYPDNVYDYYKINRVVQIGTSIPNVAQYNEKISDVLKSLGPTKEANIVLVFTNKAKSIAPSIRNKWIGGKKNDVIIVIGTKDNKTIDWVESYAWSIKPAITNHLRDDIMAVNDIENIDAMFSTITRDISVYYQRKPMKDFEYLKNEIEPPLWVIILTVLLSLSTTVGMIYTTNNDL
jgi:hypothetical protein